MRCHRCGRIIKAEKEAHYLSLGFHGHPIILCNKCFVKFNKFMDEILRPPKEATNSSMTWSIPSEFFLQIERE